MLADTHSRRVLHWDACYNVRDVGGYDTVDGRQTRWGALLRSDNLCRLTPEGQAALVAHGVRTIIDLRSPSEQIAPHPFADPIRYGSLLAYLALPLQDDEDKTASAELHVEASVRKAYAVYLDRFAPRVAIVVRAVADAPEGGVLVHCHAGKDRTGVVVALLLALAGVPHDTIAADYALSDALLRPLYAQDTPGQRLASRPDVMLATLVHLNATYGSVRSYLKAQGVSARDMERIKERLCV
jgi:protein-tyrosine phosphatase